jgi:hypothetical protein
MYLVKQIKQQMTSSNPPVYKTQKMSQEGIFPSHFVEIVNVSSCHKFAYFA